MEVLIIEQENKKIAIVDGEEQEVVKDKNGYEFFTLPQDFHGRLDLAIEAVKADEADNILLFNKKDRYTPPESVPIRFVDRSIGKNTRQKWLEQNNNDYLFAYGVEILYDKKSCLLSDNYLDFAVGERANKFAKFNSYREAEEFCDKTLDELDEKISNKNISVGEAMLFSRSQLWSLAQDAYNSGLDLKLVPFSIILK